MAESRNQDSTYQARIPIFPRSVKGKFRSLKWTVLTLAYGVYFLLPWLRWERLSGSSQAVLFDIQARRFYVFDLVVHPQQIILVGGLSGDCRTAAVLRHRYRRPRVLRLFLFPDPVDGRLHPDRTPGSGGASGAHPVGQGTLAWREDLEAGGDPCALAAGGACYRYDIHLVLGRCAAACAGYPDRATRRFPLMPLRCF